MGSRIIDYGITNEYLNLTRWVQFTCGYELIILRNGNKERYWSLNISGIRSTISSYHRFDLLALRHLIATTPQIETTKNSFRLQIGYTLCSTQRLKDGTWILTTRDIESPLSTQDVIISTDDDDRQLFIDAIDQFRKMIKQDNTT